MQARQARQDKEKELNNPAAKVPISPSVYIRSLNSKHHNMEQIMTLWTAGATVARWIPDPKVICSNQVWFNTS